MSTTTNDGLLTTMADQVPEVDKLLFTWFDHSIFVVMLGISAVIGIYFGFFGKKQDNVAEYILGGKQMKTFPIAMSLVASDTSAITLLGVPADIYAYGAAYWLCVISICITGMLTIFVYLPVFYKLQLTSSYEYLKLRFDSRMRILASFLFCFSMILNLPIVIYIPALAFAQVTNINIYWITPIVCFICIFYTTIGGLKAVVWTDTLQFSIMIAAMVVVLFLGFNATGGVAYVFEKSYEKGRLNLWDMNPDPTVRTSFWSVVIGVVIISTSYVAVNQCFVQKFLSLPSIGSAKRSIVIVIFGIFVVKTISSITGLIIFAKYFECDPLTTKKIERADQLLPYFIMDVAGKIPGLPGLFIAGVFCAALSTMSAGLNTLSGVLYEDFIKAYMPRNTTEKRASDIMKSIVVIVGIICTCMVYIVERLGNILPLAISFLGLVSGPLLGMFTLGMLVPFANTKGALTGTLCGLFVIGWIVFGAQYHIAQGGIITPKLPISVEGCDFPVDHLLTNATTIIGYTPPWVYRISFFYYGLIGVTITVIVGMVISLLTGGLEQKVDRDLISPIMHFTLPKERVMEYQAVNTMEFTTKGLTLEKEENK